MELGARDYLEGLAFALPTLAACVAAGWLAVARRVAGVHAVVRALAVFLAGSVAFVVAHLVPGAFGVLSREAVLVAALALLAGALLIPCGLLAPPPRRADSGDDPRWLTAMAVAGVTVAAGGALAYLVARSTHAVVAVDALTTHLPTVARWIQTGSYWQLVQYAPDLSNATYPHNGTLMLLAAVLPWEHTFLVRYVDVAFLVAAAVALYALARELGAPGAASALAAAAITTLAAVNEPALEQAQVDPPMLAWFAAGSLFLLRSARGAPLAETVLAGCGLGLAFGTKWYAVAYVPLLVAAWLFGRRGWRHLTALIAVGAATGGFWLVRNWVETGSPVHPAKIAVGGITIFDAPPDPLRELAGYTVSDYLLDLDVWQEWFIPAYRENFGILGPLLLLAAAAALVVAWRRRGAPLVIAGLTLAMAALYTKLPDTAFGLPGMPTLVGANARYLVPALMGGGVLAAWLAGTRGATWPGVVCALLLAGIVDGVLRSYDGVRVDDVARAGAVLAVAAGVVWAAGRRRPHPAVALAGIVLVATGVGWNLRNRALVEPYDRLDPVIAWIIRELPPGSRIAVGKTWTPGGVSPVLPAFGPRLDNRVEYLGTFVDGTLRQWRRREGFARQVRRGRYDAIVLGNGIPSEPRGEEPQATWAQQLGYRERARSHHLVLLAR